MEEALESESAFLAGVVSAAWLGNCEGTLAFFTLVGEERGEYPSEAESGEDSTAIPMIPLDSGRCGEPSLFWWHKKVQ